MVKWIESIGLALVHRDLTSMTVKTPVTGATVKYDILQTFPFTSETKRMGIIVKVRRKKSFYSVWLFRCVKVALRGCKRPIIPAQPCLKFRVITIHLKDVIHSMPCVYVTH